MAEGYYRVNYNPDFDVEISGAFKHAKPVNKVKLDEVGTNRKTSQRIHLSLLGK
jgi:hypothetical protein